VNPDFDTLQGTELAGLTVGISCLVAGSYELHKYHIGGWP